MQNTHSVSYQLGLIQIGIIIFAIGVYVYTKYSKTRASGASSDGPLLASEGLLSTPGLTALNKGMIAGFDYTIMTNDAGSVMVMVELGRSTGVHLVAYGDKSRIGPLVLGGISQKWLEPVQLEGDFPDYFHMYVSPQKQIEVRQVFVPNSMAQFADFCRAYDFEIFDDCLYIAQSNGARDMNDETTLVTDITNFLQANAETLRHL